LAAATPVIAVQVSDEDLERDFAELILSEVSSKGALTAYDLSLTYAEQDSSGGNPM
jgi:hypothetical protein